MFNSQINNYMFSWLCHSPKINLLLREHAFMNFINLFLYTNFILTLKIPLNSSIQNLFSFLFVLEQWNSNYFKKIHPLSPHSTLLLRIQSRLTMITSIESYSWNYYYFYYFKHSLHCLWSIPIQNLFFSFLYFLFFIFFMIRGNPPWQGVIYSKWRQSKRQWYGFTPLP